MEQVQPQLQMEPQTELHADDTQKNKNGKNNNANCSHTADSIASLDSQKNKGWYEMYDTTDHKLDINSRIINTKPFHDHLFKTHWLVSAIDLKFTITILCILQAFHWRTLREM